MDSTAKARRARAYGTCLGLWLALGCASGGSDGSGDGTAMTEDADPTGTGAQSGAGSASTAGGGGGGDAPAPTMQASDSTPGQTADQAANQAGDQTPHQPRDQAAGSGNAQAESASGGAQAGAQMPAQTMDGPAESFTPSAQLDPSVEFEWPEWQPGGEDHCQDGTYTGTFECTFTDSTGLIVAYLEGPVSLTFMKSMDGEFLEITDGRFDAIANLIIGASADIQGKLDCGTLMLQAMAIDGQWAIGDPELPLVPGGALEGEITGTLDPSTGELSGEWNFGDPAFGLCPGTWSVRYQP